MRTATMLLVLLLAVGMPTSCAAPPGEIPQTASASQEAPAPPPMSRPPEVEDSTSRGALSIHIIVGGAVFEARLHGTPSAHALVDALPLTLDMADHAGQEKVAPLPFDMPPAETERPDTIRAGELYLWSGSQLVLFYTTFQNSYGGYVRLGAVEDVEGLATALGGGTAAVTFATAPEIADKKQGHSLFEKGSAKTFSSNDMNMSFKIGWREHRSLAGV